MPTNSSNGNSSLAMPASNSTSSGPTSVPVDSTWVTAPDSGRLTRMAPKPIGSSRDGSISFLIASQINRPPIPHITTCCHCRFHRFPNSSCIHSPPCFNAILIQTAKRKRLPPRRGYNTHARQKSCVISYKLRAVSRLDVTCRRCASATPFCWFHYAILIPGCQGGFAAAQFFSAA